MNLNFYRLNKIKKYLQYEIKDDKFIDDDLLDEIAKKIRNDVGILELKNVILPAKKFINLAQKIKLVCAELNVIFLITNRCDLAIALDCDGVVLEKDQFDVHFVRHLLGNEKIIGAYDLNEHQADFFIVENNDFDFIPDKIYFKKISKDCRLNSEFCLHRAYRE